ncbi:MAG: FtsX-like permease family protein, partial [Terriglobales bacterium]
LVPLTSSPVRFSFAAHGPAPPPGPGLEGAAYAAVSPSYFSLLKIPLLAGRVFAGGSRSDEAVIDLRMARQIIGPGADLSRVLGATVNVGTDARVVGVVATAHALTGEPHTSPQVYRPYLTDPAPTTMLLVRSNLSPRALQGELQALASRIAPGAEVHKVQRLPDLLSQMQAVPRFQASLFSLLGLISVLLASLGAFSVLASAGVRRRREYAIRIALGAAPRRIRAEVLADALRLFLPGALAGLVVALLAAHVLSVNFPQVAPDDGTGVVLGVLATLAGAALAAVFATLPAVKSRTQEHAPAFAARLNRSQARA